MITRDDLLTAGRSIHHLGHRQGVCDCRRPPVDLADQHASLVETFADRAVAQARAHGIDPGQLTPEERADLGAAELHAYKQQVLDRLRGMVAAQRQAARTSDSQQDQASAEEFATRDARHLPVHVDQQTSAGQVDTVGGEVNETPVRNEENGRVYDRPDDDERWSPL